MIVLLAFALTINAVLLWGIYNHLADINEALFEERYTSADNNLYADFIGRDKEDDPKV